MDADACAQNRLEQAVAGILASRKYRHVAEPVVRRIVRDEIDRRGDLRAATQAARSKLHQIGGAYLAGRLRLERGLLALQQASQLGDDEDIKRVCREIMSRHASTRERLPEIEALYGAIGQAVGPVSSVADLACGLNPLAAPWMNLVAGARYYAADMYSDVIGFLAQALPLLGLSPEVVAADVLQLYPPPVDLALILKSLPCLEQIESGSAGALVDRVRARYIVVSYPTRSLGRREKGMAATYERRFWELAAGRRWRVKRVALRTELAFIVTVDSDQ